MKNLDKISFGLLNVFLIVLLFSCTQHSGNEFRTTKEKMQFKMEKLSKSLDEKIEDLQNNLGKSSDEADQKMEDTIDKLNEQKHEIADKIEKLRNVSEDNWNEFESDVNSSMNDISNYLKDLG